MSEHRRLSSEAGAFSSRIPTITWVKSHEGNERDFRRRYQSYLARTRACGLSGRDLAPELLRLIADERTLRLAWNQLEKYGGQAPGPDGHCYDDFRDQDKWRACRTYRDEIFAGQYTPRKEKVIRIPKGPGRGTRPLVLQSIFDRIVQRATVEILQPVLDPMFDCRSFGFRPGKSPLHALALAEKICLEEKRTVWVAADIRDAFTSVPLSRLTEIIKKHLPADDLVGFLGKVLGHAKVPGLRQGGPLSPLLLNLYLHHLVDQKWRNKNPAIPLLRYADDILLLCRTTTEAERAYDDLAEMLRPTGMSLKEDRHTAVRSATPEEPVEWMGFRIERTGDQFRVGLGDSAWWHLAEHLLLAHAEPNSPIRANQSICGWLAQKGPCYPFLDFDKVYGRIVSIAREQALDETPVRQEIQHLWQSAYARWIKTRDLVRRKASKPRRLGRKRGR